MSLVDEWVKRDEQREQTKLEAKLRLCEAFVNELAEKAKSDPKQTVQVSLVNLRLLQKQLTL